MKKKILVFIMTGALLLGGCSGDTATTDKETEEELAKYSDDEVPDSSGEGEIAEDDTDDPPEPLENPRTIEEERAEGDGPDDPDAAGITENDSAIEGDNDGTSFDSVVLIDDDYVTFELTGNDESTDEIFQLEVLLSNKTEDMVYVSIGAFSIDGASVGDSLLITTNENGSEYGYLTADIDALDRAGIDSPESITLEITVGKGNPDEDRDAVEVLDYQTVTIDISDDDSGESSEADEEEEEEEEAEEASADDSVIFENDAVTVSYVGTDTGTLDEDEAFILTILVENNTEQNVTAELSASSLFLNGEMIPCDCDDLNLSAGTFGYIDIYVRNDMLEEVGSSPETVTSDFETVGFDLTVTCSEAEGFSENAGIEYAYVEYISFSF